MYPSICESVDGFRTVPSILHINMAEKVVHEDPIQNNTDWFRFLKEALSKSSAT